MALDEHASVCTFDCPDTCSLTVDVDDGRIVKVRGSHAAPYTEGVICNKVARYTGDFVHGPQRLLYPLRRSGPKGSGQFEHTSWEEALDEIYERVGAVIGRWGPQAGPHGFLAGDSMSLRFFHRLGASQLYRRALCGGVRSEAWAGTYGAVPGCICLCCPAPISFSPGPSRRSSNGRGRSTKPSSPRMCSAPRNSWRGPGSGRPRGRLRLAGWKRTRS